MRFLCVYKPESPESDRPPTPEEQEKMGKLLGEMAKAGVLLAVEGCRPSALGARVRIDGGRHSVTDGPFPETKELIAGLCMLQVKSKDEAIEWAKRFLTVMGEGRCEVLALHDAPAAG